MVIQGSTLQTLRAGLRGTAHAPGEEGYEEASRAWNLAALPFHTGDTYVNFMELDDASAERMKGAYAPEDFERLVVLKDRYDPHNAFRFNRIIAPSNAEHQGPESRMTGTTHSRSRSILCECPA